MRLDSGKSSLTVLKVITRALNRRITEEGIESHAQLHRAKLAVARVLYIYNLVRVSLNEDENTIRGHKLTSIKHLA